jgi:hypothetical protein
MTGPHSRRWFLGTVAGAAAATVLRLRRHRRTAYATPAEAGGNVPVTVVNTGTFNQPSGSAITSRPNDGTGFWADFSNTGYKYSLAAPTNTAIPCTHGYTGLFDYATGMTSAGLLDVTGGTGTHFARLHIKGTIRLGFAGGTGWIFDGCVFDGTKPNDDTVRDYTSNVTTFNYCTFKPDQLTAPPGNNGTVSSAHAAPGTPYSQSWQYAGRLGTAIWVMDHCDVWGNAGLEVLNGTAGQHNIFNACYIHDCSDTDGSGGSGYHQDGIGPDSTGPETFIDVTNCTIASLGNTNGIAFQGDNGCHDITVTGNYISGWGLAVSLAAGTSYLNDYNITFTDNVYSAELAAVFGPLYGAPWTWSSAGSGSPGTGMLWRRNRYQARAGDGNGNFSAADNGRYWYPTDNASHASDYTG